MSWALTEELSPRPTVRVATVDAYGETLNEYSTTARVTGPAPETPWAVYLADPQRRFRLLCFDLDAKTAGRAPAAARDAETIAQLLTDAGLEPVICESGPSGGRHVWAGLAEPVDAGTVKTLATLAGHLCPTLDKAPLSNPHTGCVRPPGAPHRSGGHSTILSGNVVALTQPTGTVAHVHQVVEALAQLVNEDEPTHAPTEHGPLPLDDHSRPYLSGPRRSLPASAAAALREDAASGDASAVLWRVLLGAAGARWKHADIAALVDTAPGLEHIRTQRDRGDRRPRTRHAAKRILREQWDKAVRHVASTRRTRVGTDDSFDARAAAIAALVRDVQARADVQAGRWTRGGGPTDRRILDVIGMLTLRAVSASVEADTRRLALLAGIGRETARTALLRLSEHGWITKTHGPDGPHGSHWQLNTIPAEVIPSLPDSARSQADPRAPQGAGAAERTVLLQLLEDRITAAAHDLFTLRPGLGHYAGNLYARTSPTDPLTLAELANLTGSTIARTAHTLDRLADAGVIRHGQAGWRRGAAHRRDTAAELLGADGRLAQRADRYTVEREVWARWQAELAWMQAPQRERRRRPGPGQLALVPMPGVNRFGAYPRTPDGRADHRAARAYVTGTPLPEPITPALNLVTDAERLIIDILGGTLISTEPLPTSQPNPEQLKARDRLRSRGSHDTGPRFARIDESA